MKNSVIVLPELKDAESVGLMTWWRLTEERVQHNVLAEACEREGFDVPPLPSDDVALRRALRELHRGRRTMLRTLPEHVYAIVDEEIVQDDDELFDPEYDVRFKAFIVHGEVRFDRDDVSVDQRERVVREYNDFRNAVTSRDLTKMFVKEVYAVEAIGLRDTGGIYFVPQPRVAQWRKFASMIHGICASRIHTVPAMRADDAVAAVLDALKADAQAQIATLMSELDERELGKRALRRRAQQVDELSDKLRTYEQLLGVKLTEIREQLVDADGAVADAILTLEDD